MQESIAKTFNGITIKMKAISPTQVAKNFDFASKIARPKNRARRSKLVQP